MYVPDMNTHTKPNQWVRLEPTLLLDLLLKYLFFK